MGPKRKKSAPFSKHHPSQSGEAVTAATRKEVKDRQDGTCWLCGHKEDNNVRLEVCHIMPQAKTERIYFEAHHKAGRIYFDSIQSPANLVALCWPCHLSFDTNVWTFLPEDFESWIDRVSSDQDFIPSCNSRKDVRYRRWRLPGPAPFVAAENELFEAAFINEPVKMWHGEPGAAVLGAKAVSTLPLELSPALEDMITRYNQLYHQWLRYKNPCTKEVCKVCRPPPEPEEGPSQKKRRSNVLVAEDRQRYALRQTTARQEARRTRLNLRSAGNLGAAPRTTKTRQQPLVRKHHRRRNKNSRESSLYDESFPVPTGGFPSWHFTSNDFIYQRCAELGIPWESLSNKFYARNDDKTEQSGGSS